MTSICQKEIDLCKNIQNNLDGIRKLYSEIDPTEIDMKDFTHKTLDLFDIDYHLEFWKIRSFHNFDRRFNQSNWIDDPGVKISYDLEDNNPLNLHHKNITGMNFFISKSYHSLVLIKSIFTFIHSSDPNREDMIYHINNKQVNLTISKINERYDINLPLDISTWTNDDIFLLKMCV